MADLSDVYGQKFQQESSQARINYVINIIANNLGNRQFKFKLADANHLWDANQSLPTNLITNLIHKVHHNNPKLTIKHINKYSDQINMLPELIMDTPVEYFLIIDAELGRAYIIYITPTEVHSY